MKLRPLRRWLAGAVVAARRWRVPCRSRRAGGGHRQWRADHRARHRAAHQADRHFDAQERRPRQEVIDELIDDRLKIAKAKTLRLRGDRRGGRRRPSPTWRRASASRRSNSPQVLERAGISPSTRQGAHPRRADLEPVGPRQVPVLLPDRRIRHRQRAARPQRERKRRGRLRSTRSIRSCSWCRADRRRPPSRPAPRGRKPARPLRQSCDEGLALARALRDVAVREPVIRSSADLPPQLREVLGSIEVGRLTAPEVTAQGVQMFALCDKKESNDRTRRPSAKCARSCSPSGSKPKSKKFLEEMRSQAMIEYK